MFCAGCHQIPSPEVRNFARIVESAAVEADPGPVREQSWRMIVTYMSWLTAEAVGRAVKRVGAFSHEEAYNFTLYDSSLGKPDPAQLLSKYLADDFDHLEGYEYGAPLVVTPRTVIREYEIPGPNTVREAVLLGTPPRLWVADLGSNNVISVDVKSGAQQVFTIPTELYTGAHTLQRTRDNLLWVAGQFNSIVARLDPVSHEWRVWRTLTETGGDVGIHDMAFNWRSELAPDLKGRIWFSDIHNNAIGYLDPETGESETIDVPEVPQRTFGMRPYGMVMASDREHVWYTQLGIGTFGSFNTTTMEFEIRVQLADADAGPRRIAIDENDVIYIPLFGAGQLIEYDTRTRKQLGIYDLPDRASAPYAAVWDPGRQVAWIVTANADAIYRFDPASKAFGVLPLPREQAYLRGLQVDPETGLPATSYANLPKRSHGPRMALLIDPGDGYDQGKQITPGDDR